MSAPEQQLDRQQIDGRLRGNFPQRACADLDPDHYGGLRCRAAAAREFRGDDATASMFLDSFAFTGRGFTSRAQLHG